MSRGYDEKSQAAVYLEVGLLKRHDDDGTSTAPRYPPERAGEHVANFLDGDIALTRDKGSIGSECMGPSASRIKIFHRFDNFPKGAPFAFGGLATDNIDGKGKAGGVVRVQTAGLGNMRNPRGPNSTTM